MKKIYTLLYFFVFSQGIIAQIVSLKEMGKVFKTYPFSDPNPIPKPDKIYPYFRFDGFTDVGIQKEWKTIELENDFVKITILPEIGGKIWGAYEKSKNFPFIYYNHVVKFRDVGMRGAWTSGGVEINFGDIGHAPTVANPVDYFTRKNPDGSASCFLSATDWPSGTRWTVEVNLEKDKAYFTTKSNWYNASPIEQSYYHWMNAGFKAAGNLEFTYPGSNFIGHGGELGPWKVDSAGHQLNYYEKNNFGSYKSYHVMGKKTDFFGGYWHDDQMGFGHYSNYADKLGKKIWVWGLSREGMIWENLLTDTDGQYVELQSGRLFNQAAAESIQSPFKFMSFMPYSSDTFDELWFPVNGTQGIETANFLGAINFKNDKIYFSSLQNIEDSLKIFQNNKLIFSHLLKMKPMEKVEFDFVKKENINVYIGKTSLVDNDENSAITRPKTAPNSFDWNAEYSTFLKAKSLANQRNYVESKRLLEEIIEKNTNYLPALSELAQINYRFGEYETAHKNLLKALSINTYDGQANYLWGLVNEKLNRQTDAIDGFSVATLTPAYRSGALLHLAIIYAQKNNWNKAKEYAEKCHAEFPQNIDNQNLILTINRNLGENTLDKINQYLSQNPLNHYARAELFLQNGDYSQLSKAITNEFPQLTYLEIANWYAQIAQKSEALKILELSPNFPTVSYWKAYLKYQMNLPYKTELEAAISAPIDFVFPYKNEDIEVIKWAENQQHSLKNYYYLGLLYWKNNQRKLAQDAFEKVGEYDNAIFQLAKAALFQDDIKVKATSLQKAYALEPTNWRTIKSLSDYLVEEKRYSEALIIVEKFVKEKPGNFLIGQIYARLLAYNQQFSNAINYMDHLNILPNEGASETIGLYKELNILEAIEQVKKKNWKAATKYLDQAETYPEHLGSGMPYNPNNDLTQKMKKAISGKKIVTTPEILASLTAIQYPFSTNNYKEKMDLLWKRFDYYFRE